MVAARFDADVPRGEFIEAPLAHGYFHVEDGEARYTEDLEDTYLLRRDAGLICVDMGDAKGSLCAATELEPGEPPVETLVLLGASEWN